MSTLSLPESQLRIRLLADFLNGLKEFISLEESEVKRIALLDRNDDRSLIRKILLPSFEQVSVRIPESRIVRRGRRLDLLSDCFSLCGQGAKFDHLAKLHAELVKGAQKFSMVVRLVESLEFIEPPKNLHEVYRQPALRLLWTGNMCLSAEQAERPEFTSLSIEAAKVLVTLKHLGGETRYVKSFDVYRKSSGPETSDMKRRIREELREAELIKCSGGSHGGMQLTVAGLAEAKSVESQLGSELFS